MNVLNPFMWSFDETFDFKSQNICVLLKKADVRLTSSHQTFCLWKP